MKRIRKFNESFPNIPYGRSTSTREELLSTIKYIGCEEGEYGPIIIGEKIMDLEDGTSLHYSNNTNTDDLVLIVSNGKVKVVICSYELMNPTVFKGIVIAPGHDDIVLYDIKSGESFELAIR